MEKCVSEAELNRLFAGRGLFKGGLHTDSRVDSIKMHPPNGISLLFDNWLMLYIGVEDGNMVIEVIRPSAP